MLYCLNQITSRFDENGWRWLRQFVEQLRIPRIQEINSIANIARNANSSNQTNFSKRINEEIARLYDLDENEQNYIDEKLSGY